MPIYIFSPEKRLYAAVVIGLQPSFSSCGWLLTSWHHKLTPRNWIILARKNQLRRRVVCPKWDSFELKIFAFQHANTHTHTHTHSKEGRASGLWSVPQNHRNSTKSVVFLSCWTRKNKRLLDGTEHNSQWFMDRHFSSWRRSFPARQSDCGWTVGWGWLFQGMFYGQEVELVRFFYWHVIHLWPISEDYDASRTGFGGMFSRKKLFFVALESKPIYSLKYWYFETYVQFLHF